jgi:hypothetical protein
MFINNNEIHRQSMRVLLHLSITRSGREWATELTANIGGDPINPGIWIT